MEKRVSLSKENISFEESNSRGFASNRRRLDRLKIRRSRKENNFSILSHLEAKMVNQINLGQEEPDINEGRIKVSEILAKQSRKVGSRLLQTQNLEAKKIEKSEEKKGCKSSSYLNGKVVFGQAKTSDKKRRLENSNSHLVNLKEVLQSGIKETSKFANLKEEDIFRVARDSNNNT